MLRSRIPHRIYLKDHERQKLIELGKPIQPALRSLISVVTYRTFCRWTQDKPAQKGSRKMGRPRTPQFIQDLIIRIAKETGWGYTKIFGELRKLRINQVSITTVRRTLNQQGIYPGPYRDGSWQKFLKSHWQTLWACDFFTKKVITPKGWVEYYVLFFIHLQSRKVFYAGATPHPNEAWVCQQARNFSMHADDLNLNPSALIIDRDNKFTDSFKNILEAQDAEVKVLPPRSPNLNAFAERWVRSIKNECLDHFLVFGWKHLDYLICEYVSYYNRLRPHMAKDNLPLEKIPDSVIPFDPKVPVERKEYLGGVLNHYRSNPPPPEPLKLAA